MFKSLLIFLGLKKRPDPSLESEEGFLVIYMGVRQSVEENLLAVSNKYPKLKKTTLYRSFRLQKGLENQKFVKYGYVVKKL